MKTKTDIVQEIVNKFQTKLKKKDTFMPYTFYITTDEVSIYFKCNAVFHSDYIIARSLIISNIFINPEWRGQGIFKELVKSLPRRYPYLVIECVHNPRLRDYLLRNNWGVKEDITFFKKL